MMEFGAMVCKPRNPDCRVCPLSQQCFALRNDRIAELPVKKKAQPPRPRHFNYAVVLSGDLILLNKRGPKDIWENLYEFPLFESERPLDVSEVLVLPDFVRAFGEGVTVLSVHGPMKHQLSHQTIHAQFVVIETNKPGLIAEKGWQFVGLDELQMLAQPKIIFSFLRNFLH